MKKRGSRRKLGQPWGGAGEQTSSRALKTIVKTLALTLNETGSRDSTAALQSKVFQSYSGGCVSEQNGGGKGRSKESETAVAVVQKVDTCF